MKALEMLRGATGLNLSRTTVDRAVQARMAATGFVDRDDYTATIDAVELAALVELVVVPESWLFRDPQAFAVAAAYAKKRLAAGTRLLRMLSIPCAGGEEPYTLAMAMADAGVPPTAFAIDAVDLSAACIARAREGRFGRNAFRGKDLAFRDRHFTHEGDDEYRIDAALRARVRFSQGNLLTTDLAPAGTYDIVFCRNLLIYFDAPTTATAISRLYALLADDGVLLAGYAEVPSFVRNGFAVLPYRQAFALRKDTTARQDTAPAAWHGLPLAMSDGLAAPRPKQPRSTATAAMIAAPPPAPRPVFVERRAVPRPPPPAPVVPPDAPAPGVLDEARRLADQGRPGEAERLCRAVLAREPGNADAWFLLGLVSEQSAPDEAENHLRRCIYLAPDHYDALCHLALLAGQRGDAATAATLKARAGRVWRRLSPDKVTP